MTEGDWMGHSRHVLKSLERLEKSIGELQKEVAEQKTILAVKGTTLKIYIFIWSTVSAVVMSSIGSIVVGVILYRLTNGA